MTSSDAFTVNSQHISHLVLVFLLLILSRFLTAENSKASFLAMIQVNNTLPALIHFPPYIFINKNLLLSLLSKRTKLGISNPGLV